MSNKRLTRTVGSLAIAAGLAYSNYVRADETNSVPNVSTNVISLSVRPYGLDKVRVDVKGAVPNSKDNYIEARERFPGDENLGGSWKVARTNIWADFQGNYTELFPINKKEEYFRAGRPVQNE
jgi:hypothetical protein